MLVRLTSSTSGDVIMFAEHARNLFEAIGKECTAHGVFSKEQLPDAIRALRRAVDDENEVARCDYGNKHTEAKNDDEGKKQETDEVVSLAQRAIPLIRLMEFTIKEGGFILWEASADF